MNRMKKPVVYICNSYIVNIEPRHKYKTVSFKTCYFQQDLCNCYNTSIVNSGFSVVTDKNRKYIFFSSAMKDCARYLLFKTVRLQIISVINRC